MTDAVPDRDVGHAIRAAAQLVRILVRIRPDEENPKHDAIIRDAVRSLEHMVEEVRRLRNGIRKHRDAKGHDRCWQNNLELYALLPDTTPGNLPGPLPPWPEFVARCEAYHAEEERKQS
jgi:hypothetical protein